MQLENYVPHDLMPSRYSRYWLVIPLIQVVCWSCSFVRSRLLLGESFRMPGLIYAHIAQSRSPDPLRTPRIRSKIKIQGLS